MFNICNNHRCANAIFFMLGDETKRGLVGFGW